MVQCIFLEGQTCRFAEVQKNWSGFLSSDPERLEIAKQEFEKIVGFVFPVGVSAIPLVMQMGLHLTGNITQPDKRKDSGKCRVSAIEKGQKECRGYIENEVKTTS